MGIWVCSGSCGAGVAVGCGTQPVSDRATRARSLGNGDMAGEGGGSWSWESAVVGGMVLVAGSGSGLRVSAGSGGRGFCWVVRRRGERTVGFVVGVEGNSILRRYSA